MRHRRRHRARADTPRLRYGRRGGSRACRRARSGLDRDRPCRRSRRARSGRLCASVPRSGCRCGRRPDRHLRHQSDIPGDQLRLYPPRRQARRQDGVCGGLLRRETGCRDRGPLHRRSLSVEQRQLRVPRRRDARRDRPFRTGHRRSRQGRRRRHHQRSRFPAAAGRSVRAGAEKIHRLCGDGAHQACRRAAGRLRLVGRRQLERGLGLDRATTPTAMLPQAPLSFSTAATASLIPTERSSRHWSAWTISWWWRRRTPCW